MPKIHCDRLKRQTWRYLLLALLCSLLIVACDRSITRNRDLVNAASTNNKVLKVWWDKGFTLEDEALQQIVSNWEKQSGNKVTQKT